MKTSIGKRLGAFLLAVAMVLGMIPVVAIPKAEAADYASVNSKIRNLPYPAGELVKSLPGDMNGLWLIMSSTVRGGTGDTAGTFGYVLNPDAPESGEKTFPEGYGTDHPAGYVGYAVRPAYVPNRIERAQPTSGRFYTRITGVYDSCTLQSVDGLYWTFENISGNSTWKALRLRSSTNYKFNIDVHSATDGLYKLKDASTGKIFLNTNSWTFRGRTSSTSGETNVRFYRVSQEMLDYRNFLVSIMDRVGSNASGRYDAQDFDAFLTIMNSVGDNYNSINNNRAGNQITAADRQTMANDKVRMWDAIAKLTLSDSTKEYMDIPVEILDFRGDGFLFESKNVWSSPYSLSNQAADINTDRYPGTLVEHGGADNFRVTGLVEDTLAEGKVVYTRKTVDYIAYHISQRTDLRGNLGTMNSIFYTMADQGLVYTDDGYDLTLAKTEGGMPGDKLPWNQVKTAHDLAYYLLSHMWVESKDVISTTENTTYNMAVPELSRIRLHKSGDAYVYDANQSSCYDYGYIFNDYSGRTVPSPRFQPLSNRGFESADRYGFLTEGHEQGEAVAGNYLFTVHAYGGFVYTEGSELFFEFGGDDDIYFFINGERVADIGGVHGLVKEKVYLNDIAASLGLEEGQVCRFDMFHAERHTSGINFTLSTNIRLMDESLITEKNQYDPATGNIIADGTAVAQGTDIAYAFSLQNRRTAPVKDVRFADSKLNVVLDGAAKTISGLEPDGTNISLVYRAYDAYSGTVAEGEPDYDAYDFDTFSRMLGEFAASTSWTPLGTGVYGYYPKNQQELIDLLALGIPAACKLTITGIPHTTVSGLYENSLTTVCTPIEFVPGADNTVTPKALEPISGLASCRYYGLTADLVTIDSPYRVILDYGKAVEVDLEKVRDFIGTDSGMTLEYVGSLAEGDHGRISTVEPVGMTFKAVGDGYDTDFGPLEMTSHTTVRFTPTAFMSSVVRFYPVYRIHVASDAGFTAYVRIAVEFIPATMVYYEAEDFAHLITLDKKVTKNGTVSRTDQWSQGDEDGSGADSLQEGLSVGEERPISDYRGRTDILFLDFDNSDAAKDRYSLPQYKGNNFDNWTWDYNDNHTASVKIEAGNLVVTPRGDRGDDDNMAIWTDCSPGNILLTDPSRAVMDYDPADAEVFQVRFKAEGLTNGNQDPYISLHLWVQPKEGMTITDSEGKNTAARAIDAFFMSPSVLDSGEYITWTFRLDTEHFHKIQTVLGMRLYFRGARSKDPNNLGTLKYDYVYMGPAKDAPLAVSYGQDNSYADDTYYSNGDSLFIEGSGIWNVDKPEPASYTNMHFSFTGTGFDLITRTGMEQTNIRVDIFTDPERTKWEKAVESNLSGTTEIYQVPAISVHDLDYGTYYVTVKAMDAVNVPYLPMLNHGNHFHFDAIRIYDPMDTTGGRADADAQAAYVAYCEDREAYGVNKELRDILLTAGDFDALQGETQGALFIDYEEIPKVTAPVIDEEGETTGGSVDITDPELGTTEAHISANVVTYEKVGPKNEVYLAPRQLVAFKLYVYSNELPDRLDVAGKLLNGTEAELSLVLSRGKDLGAGIFEIPIRSSSAQYYSIPLLEEAFVPGVDPEGNACYWAYIVIQNKHQKGSKTTDNVLSLTDIKVAFSSRPTPIKKGETRTVELPVDDFAPVGFGVDLELYPMVEELLENQMGICNTHSPGDWVVLRDPMPGQDGMIGRYCQSCGALCESEITATVTEIAFAGASVSLQSDLAINYKVDEAYVMKQGYADPFVVIHDNGTETILREYELRDGKLVFVYRNIAPHRIGDKITATLYAYHGETLYQSPSRDYSVADYCYNMLGKTEGIAAYDKLRTLLVDILLYGAKTQEYMSYRLDSLCTDRLTEAQLACGTSECRELVNHRDQAYETIDNPTVQWKGAGLNLRESVAIRFKIQAENYEDLEVRITLAGKTYVIKAKDFDHRADGTYVHFKNINAAQMSEPVYAAVYRNGEQVSHTICYSIESYAYSKQNDSIPHLADLVKRMMCYGDSTKAYVEN